MVRGGSSAAALRRERKDFVCFVILMARRVWCVVLLDLLGGSDGLSGWNCIGG